ncbi:MAG: hypothetical protein ACTFAL_11925 [Candidatus Electronema sp. V4]|uniref:hypothetical protein n=1 Tax=Candidatus Electronema sp. V4 TaxID=3454756 RepID=UPI0040558FE7
MSIGQDLLDVPFAEMVSSLATAVADGQLALDQASIATLKFLADPANAVPLIPEIAEIVEKASTTVTVDTSSGPTNVAVDGVSVRSQPAAPVKTTLLQAGILPTFYQFTEAQIEVKLAISIKNVTNTDSSGTSVPLLRKRMAFGSPVNFRTKNTYSYDAQGSSTLRITMRPVPPPPRILPDVVTVNALATPPTVTRSEH